MFGLVAAEHYGIVDSSVTSSFAPAIAVIPYQQLHRAGHVSGQILRWFGTSRRMVQNQEPTHHVKGGACCSKLPRQPQQWQACVCQLLLQQLLKSRWERIMASSSSSLPRLRCAWATPSSGPTTRQAHTMLSSKKFHLE